MKPDEFYKGFVLALVQEGDRLLRPKSEPDRRGFTAMVEALDDEVTKARDRGDRDWYRSLVRLRNYLRPSNIGFFDNIETELRGLQFGAVHSPNPDFDELVFDMSSAYATCEIDNLPERERHLIEHAARSFRAGRSSTVTW